MRNVLTVVIVLVWLPIAFLLAGAVFGLIEGKADGLGVGGFIAATALWIAGSYFLVKRRRLAQ